MSKLKIILYSSQRTQRIVYQDNDGIMTSNGLKNIDDPILCDKFSHEDNNPDKLKDLLVNVFGVVDTAVIDEGVEMILARNKYVHQYNVDGTSYEYIYSGKNGYLRLVKCIESISSYF